MKATVWTKWNVNVKPNLDGLDGKPKCIFSGEIAFPPRIGESVVVREGFCCERVEDIYHDFVDGSVEIHIASSDSNNEYGPCLLRNK